MTDRDSQPTRHRLILRVETSREALAVTEEVLTKIATALKADLAVGDYEDHGDHLMHIRRRPLVRQGRKV